VPVKKDGYFLSDSSMHKEDLEPDDLLNTDNRWNCSTLSVLEKLLSCRRVQLARVASFSLLKATVSSTSLEVALSLALHSS